MYLVAVPSSPTSISCLALHDSLVNEVQKKVKNETISRIQQTKKETELTMSKPLC